MGISRLYKKAFSKCVSPISPKIKKMHVKLIYYIYPVLVLLKTRLKVEVDLCYFCDWACETLQLLFFSWTDSTKFWLDIHSCVTLKFDSIPHFDIFVHMKPSEAYILKKASLLEVFQHSSLWWHLVDRMWTAAWIYKEDERLHHDCPLCRALTRDSSKQLKLACEWMKSLFVTCTCLQVKLDLFWPYMQYKNITLSIWLIISVLNIYPGVFSLCLWLHDIWKHNR